jgi:hypothetical protein
MSDKPKLYVTDTKIKDYEKSNYHKEVDKILGGMDYAPGVYHMKIEHDSWCHIYEQKACNCNPNVSKISDAEGMSRLKGEIDE